jgi:hypothetical protein
VHEDTTRQSVLFPELLGKKLTVNSISETEAALPRMQPNRSLEIDENHTSKEFTPPHWSHRRS